MEKARGFGKSKKSLMGIHKAGIYLIAAVLLLTCTARRPMPIPLATAPARATTAATPFFTEEQAATLESYKGKLVATLNSSPWQAATDFIVTASEGKSGGDCWRYNLINFRLRESAAHVGSQDALRLPSGVIQESTQWRALYHLTSGEIEIVMGNQAHRTVHKFHLDRTGNEGR